MLKKLLKYEFINIYKFMIIFYGLSLFFAILTRVFFSFDNSLFIKILGQIASGVTISMIFNILINNLMRIWIRFKESMYGDESYLLHTLPIKRSILYSSKFLSSIVCLVTSFLIIVLTLFIAYYSKENMLLLKNTLLPIITTCDASFFTLTIIIIILLFLEIANLLQIGFTGLILGHKQSKNKILFSCLFGFITYFVFQTVMVVLIFIVALFDADIMNIILTNDIVDLSPLKTLMYLAIFGYSVEIVVDYLINKNLLNKGIDVE